MNENVKLRFDAPACYRIVVQGVLPDKYYPYFHDMKITVDKNKEGIDCTTLTGVIIDQAALAGVLNMLYEFHYPILLIEYIEEKVFRNSIGYNLH